MPTLGLVACSKSKGPNRTLALLLYKGAMFRKSLALARRQCDAVAILSAKYGLVELRQTISPYNQTLKHMTVAERTLWAASTMDQLRVAYPGYDIIYYTGGLYCAGLPPGQQPMAGMKLGYRLQWLDKQLRRMT